MPIDPITGAYVPDGIQPGFGQAVSGAFPTPGLPNLSNYGVNPASTPPASGGSQASRYTPLSMYQPTDPTTQGLADLSSLFGSASSGAANQQQVKGNFTQNYDKLMLDAQQANQSTQNNALKNLAQTSYLLNGGSHYAPPTIALNGKQVTVPDAGFGPQPASDAQKAGASDLQAQALKYLAPGGTYTPTPLSSYANPSTIGKIGQAGSLITGGLGALNLLTGGNSGIISKLFGGGAKAAGTATGLSGLAGTAGDFGLPAGIGSTLGLGSGAGGAAGGLGGAASGAAGSAGSAGGFLSGMPGGAAGTLGLAAGAGLGAYGVYKNHSMGADVGSGALSGGSIGTMIAPGIGTAVGAGIGAGVGALRHAFGGPDSVEKEGRTENANDLQSIGSMATPDEIAEAKNAGWADPNEALASVVINHALAAKGLPASQGSSLINSLMAAEKHGGDAVAKAMSPIQQLLQGLGQHA